MYNGVVENHGTQKIALEFWRTLSRPFAHQNRDGMCCHVFVHMFGTKGSYGNCIGHRLEKLEVAEKLQHGNV